MENLILILILAAVVGAAITYIVKEKKKGNVCIGCPHAGTCASKNSKDSGCSCEK